MTIADLYVCAAYVVVLAACIAGAFSRSYNANLAQRLALALLALWSVWRIELVYLNGWGYPHETFVATAMLLYACGSAQKTIKWGIKRHRWTREHGYPCRRNGDMNELL